MKRNLLLAIALVFCATLFLGFAPAGKAHAAELTLNKLNAYEYAFTYLLEEAGVEKRDADNSSVMDGRYVKIIGEGLRLLYGLETSLATSLQTPQEA